MFEHARRAATAKIPFFSCGDGAELFAVQAGIPSQKALDEASCFLSVARSIAYATAEKKDPNTVYAIAYLLEMAKALVDAVEVSGDSGAAAMSPDKTMETHSTESPRLELAMIYQRLRQVAAIQETVFRLSQHPGSTPDLEIRELANVAGELVQEIIEDLEAQEAGYVQ